MANKTKTYELIENGLVIMSTILVTMSIIFDIMYIKLDIVDKNT